MGDALSNAFVQSLLVPILVIIAGIIGGVITFFGNKISKSIIAKNVMAEMQNKNNVRNELMDLIAKNVEAAVEANMQLADSMKAAGGHLDSEEIKALNNSAKQTIMNSLPLELTNSDGVLCEIIGGPDKLDSIIDNMMEKYVYECKLKKLQQQPVESAELPSTLQEYINNTTKAKVAIKARKK